LILEAVSPKAWSTSSPVTEKPPAPHSPRIPAWIKSLLLVRTEVGKLIVHAATGNLKKVSLELGGKSPNVIFKDADLESAIPGAASAIFFNHGQCCCAGSRLYVERAAFDQVVEGVAEHARNIKVGPGMEPDTQMGPLVSEEQLQRVCNYLEIGFGEGARAAAGGSKLDGKGYFVQRPFWWTRKKI